ncbi:uncharacterized protein LOC129743468 [Uranotaenia lowii]|uniref:uncharacterized protein LOC129743468 n=1 Tax=Uranotaenia lowii TaxID=190385 RepID=UPI00247AFDBB|nr:uncharacterized protein LOC129743468 [Uranotaenia lowii]
MAPASKRDQNPTGGIQKCQSAEPRSYAACVTSIIYGIKANISSGFFDGRQFPSLEPYYIDNLNCDQPPNFKLTLSKTYIKGISGFQVVQVIPNYSPYVLKLNLPKLMVSGLYDLNTQISVIPLTGKGNFIVDLNNTQAEIRVQFLKDPQGLLKIGTVETRIKFGPSKFKLTGLFGGDKAANKLGNDVINLNPGFILDRVRPRISQHVSDTLYKIHVAIFQGLKYEDVFPST